MKKLGFGCMRFPMDGGKIDVEAVKAMVDEFMRRGFTYFDTSYVYHGGDSEKVLREVLVERYPRDSFTITTKSPVFMIDSRESFRRIFDEQLVRLGTNHVDYYWLHAINADGYRKVEGLNLVDELSELKAEGLTRHIGLSYHDSPQLLDRILTDHPEFEYVQLQLNYFDWESPYVASRECYEVCARHGKQVIVMEPVKGGALASLPEGCLGRLRRVDPDASPASWAIRFAASLDDVLVVLSGMSDMAQMRDNTSFMEDFVPLGEAERAAVADVATELRRGMRYDPSSLEAAQDACPKGIGIVKIAQMLDDHLRMGGRTNTCIYYDTFLGDAARASACDNCGRCAGLSGDVDVPAMLREADETITHF